MTAYVGRLAPSPTGALHLGNARSFLLAWSEARRQGGALLLRIEDIDSPRVKPWAALQTLEDLAWLGIDWEYGPDIGGPHAPYVQSQRREVYAPFLAELRRSEAVYPCTCSRSEVAASASAPHEVGGLRDAPVYPGTCADRRSSDADHLPAEGFAWRFRTRDRLREWHDLVCGPQAANVARELGDFVVAKGDGTPAYQLAVVVDDHLMDINHVVRGNDLLASTYRQLELIEQFGWQPPRYAHVPLMVGADGRRLAKRHGDTRLSWFRAAGYSAGAILGYLAWTLHWIDRPRAFAPQEWLASALDTSTLGQQPTMVDLPELLRTLDQLNG
jgi:glutamyl-tRNA synthetase